MPFPTNCTDYNDYDFGLITCSLYILIEWNKCVHKGLRNNMKPFMNHWTLYDPIRPQKVKKVITRYSLIYYLRKLNLYGRYETFL